MAKMINLPTIKLRRNKKMTAWKMMMAVPTTRMVPKKDENVESENHDDDDDDAVEEVKGTAARESTQKIREEERKIAKESLPKKKRKKKNDDDATAPPAVDDADDDSEEEDEEEDEELLTEDFFTMVDSERADQLQKAKKEKKIKKVQEKKRMGKHTTFVVEDEYKMTNVPHKMEQNIEVVALGIGDSNNDETTTDNRAAMEERQLLLSATLGTAPSKSAIVFSRGSMARGTLKERSSDSRKRKSKNEETWKRSRKLNKLGVGLRPGQASALFVRRR
mmetsp:Transcript_13575/g.24558  ORF Transcript_13575/g.24558 Transcript_13575/m.24558 type:complete len:277 (+) Transcript_13575:139-969(+)